MALWAGLSFSLTHTQRQRYGRKPRRQNKKENFIQKISQKSMNIREGNINGCAASYIKMCIVCIQWQMRQHSRPLDQSSSLDTARLSIPRSVMIWKLAIQESSSGGMQKSWIWTLRQRLCGYNDGRLSKKTNKYLSEECFASYIDKFAFLTESV